MCVEKVFGFERNGSLYVFEEHKFCFYVSERRVVYVLQTLI